jgi:hypothetical protein
LGVGLVGHRRALLDAIAALRADLDSKAPATPSALTPLGASAAPAPGAAGERRHVTVLFCDLANLTGIAARLVPVKPPLVRLGWQRIKRHDVFPRPLYCRSPLLFRLRSMTAMKA